MRGNGATAFASLLEDIGVPAGKKGVWLVSGGHVLWTPGREEPQRHFRLDWHDLKLSRKGIVFDRENLQTVPDGVSILAYDTVTQAQAAFLTFDATS